MLSIMLAALLNTVTPSAPGAPSATRLPFARIAAELADRGAGDEEHLLKARKALMDGSLEVARREFIIAAALDRDAGVVPAEAMFGLARVYFGQGREADAARVLDELATEATRRRDLDCAALALNDALWLHIQAGRRMEARLDGQRLMELLDAGRLSPDVVREVRARFR